MKAHIHPDYDRVLFIDRVTGDEWPGRSTATSAERRDVDGSPVPVIRLDISSASHPLWTGERRELDQEGRVERFRRRWGGRRL